MPSNSKYFVYGGGRWREINVETGCVAGWAGSKFACSKRGKIVVLKTKSVVRGLKDLERGHISTVKNGVHLSKLIKKKKGKSKRSCNCKCVSENKHNQTSSHNKTIPNLSNVSIQCNIVSYNKESENNRKNAEREIDSIVSDNNAKVLTISESDVETFRKYIANDKDNIFNVDLLMFDSNDDYKRGVLYKITPIVEVKRLRMKQVISEHNKKQIKLNIKNSYNEPKKIKTIEYTENSNGDQKLQQKKQLHIVNEGRKRSNAEVNVPKPRLNGRDNSKSDTLKVSNGKPIAKVVIRKLNFKTKRRPANEFSMLEDEAIAAWLLKNKKGNLVNGNRVWKEMEPVHQQVTGSYRTWHSLRNRYLRHVLPSLGVLTITPSQAADLRAAAATGELKANKKKLQNSIYETAPVLSAWSARAQKTTADEPSTPSVLRSCRVSPRKLPTYSEITRRFAEKHRSTPISDSDGNGKRKFRDDRDEENPRKKPRVSVKPKDGKSGGRDRREIRPNRRRNEDDKTDTEVESDEKGGRLRGEDRKNVESDAEPENRQKVKNSRPSRKTGDRSGVNGKKIKRGGKDESDNEAENQKKSNNSRSSKRQRDEERSGVDRNNIKPDVPDESEPETTEKVKNSRSSRKNESVDKKNIRSRGGINGSDNEKKINNSRPTKKLGEEKRSGVDRRNIRVRRNEDESESEDKKKVNKSRSSRRLKYVERSGVHRKNLKERENEVESNTEPETIKRRIMEGKQNRNQNTSDSEDSLRQDGNRDERSSRRLRSPETSQTERNLRTRGNLVESDKFGKKSPKSSNKQNTTEDKENGAQNEFHLRKYTYRSKTNRTIENSDERKPRAKTTDKSKVPTKLDRSKRKRIDSDSETENEQKKRKREESSSGTDVVTRKRTDKQRIPSSDSDFSVEGCQVSRSDVDSPNGSDVKRVTRQSHRGARSRDNIIFEISDDDEAYASRSDTDNRSVKTRGLRKLFNHRA